MSKSRRTCPICKKKVRRTDPEFPFCSERCRILDLGNWASGRYRVSTLLPDIGEPEAAVGSAAEPPEE